VAENHVQGQAKLEKVARTVKRKLDAEPGLHGLAEFVPGANGQHEVVVTTDAAGAEVEQVAALKAQRYGVAGPGVMEPVQLHQRVDFVGVIDIEVQVQAGDKVLTAHIVGGETVTHGPHKVERTPASLAEVLGNAEVGYQGQIAGVLIHLAGAGGNLKREAGGPHRASTFNAKEGPL